MTHFHVIQASGAETLQVVHQLEAQWREIERVERISACQVRLVMAFYGCQHDDWALHHYLRERFPQAELIGGSSSGGLMTHHGVLGSEGVGLMLLTDEAGDYGVAAAPLGDDPAGLAEGLLLKALDRCACSGQLPDLIWIYQAPGHEERVLEGLRRVVGDRCAIVGGSSADDDVTQQWRQLGPQGPMAAGLVVAVMFPSAPLGCAFQSGYEPTGESGIVTEVREASPGQSQPEVARGREIVSIDDEPAAQVYNRWTQGAMADYLQQGHDGNVLTEAVAWPLAIKAGEADGVDHYLLLHPATVTALHSVVTFCEVEQGARVYAMQGTGPRLIERAGRALASARRTLGGHGLAGALVAICGGCKFAASSAAELDVVFNAVRLAADGAPFIGCFTFGEQGNLLGKNRHGNLMVSAVAFGR